MGDRGVEKERESLVARGERLSQGEMESVCERVRKGKDARRGECEQWSSQSG